MITISAIDDDIGILYTLRAMADSLGWPMRTSVDPNCALEWVRTGQVDLLLVDYHMPTMSGIELIRRVRKISHSVAIIALTVEESPSVAQQLLLSGADDFISKPIRLADFSSRILIHTELIRYRNDMNWNERSKGLSEKTTRRILVEFEGGGSYTTSQIAMITQLAYPTAHRYLEYLANKGLLLRSTQNSGERSGRPHTVYRRADNLASLRTSNRD